MDETVTQKEIDIRGKALTISTTIETQMVRIVLFSNGEQYNPSSEERLDLKNFTFHKKLELMKKKVAKHHPDLMTKYSKLMEDLIVFKEFRNKMAHCSFSWEEDGEHFKIWDASDDFTYFVPTLTSAKEIFRAMREEYIDLVSPIFHLLHEVEVRLKVSHPGIYFRLTKGQDNADEAMKSSY